MTTHYHTQYWAHALTLRGATGSIEALSRSIAGSRVDLNPHQVDAALFAIRSPLTRGVILADEVGLGKTIEAGIVIAQRWAERRRRILIIVPATLRSQWQQELETKFFLPTAVLDSQSWNAQVRTGQANPFDVPDRLVICSYHFASAKSAEIRLVPWDLVVVDEAHRLRNIYKKSSKLARNVGEAIASPPKLLLTATPLQNSLMELYGLAGVIDDHIFGDAASFREQFTRATDERARNAELRARLQPICTRTLRRQVVEYIPFTRRIPITQDFLPSDAEQELYESISEYLQRDALIALPASQRALITLVLRKLLASSTFAIAATLEKLALRLEKMSPDPEDLLDDDDLEGVSELEDEIAEQQDSDENGGPAHGDRPVDDPALLDRARLATEIADLRAFVERARRISANAKGEALIPALKTAFERAQALGAQRKAVIFTESRRTQQYLVDLLSQSGYESELVVMNGSNGDARSNEIYEAWRARQANARVGTRAVDMKTAIVEHFRDRASILVATEAAAEGVNLQFSSLVVNYDLPWNPQRIEQRIGRCHRYGQKHDVVVVNFLNRRNQADQRVFAILSEKFRLFDGVFGSSDEVLGVLESGVDIERRIARVYQQCRNTTEIKTAFDQLQAELDDQIQARMTETRQSLLENFDEDVNARLRVHRDRALESLSERERWLLDLTRVELGDHARFDADRPRFRYTGPDAANGWYHLDWKEAAKAGDTFYRQEHPLAAHAIGRAMGRHLPVATLRFDYGGHGQLVSVLKPWVGVSGWLELSALSVQTLDVEEFLIFTARADDGRPVDEETVKKLLTLPAEVEGAPAVAVPDLAANRETQVRSRLEQVEARNGRFLDEEVLKLDRWSDDLKQGLERELKELDRQIRETRRNSALAAALKDKLEAQKTLRSLEAQRTHKRRDLFEAQDAIDLQRDDLIKRIEGQLQQKHTVKTIFRFRWRLA